MSEKYKEQCNEMLTALVGKENVAKWWGSPNRAFGDRTPFLQFELDANIVRDYLIWHAYCAGG